MGGGAPAQAVSIPVGFFQALQLLRPEPVRFDAGRFNPCRVFSGLATRYGPGVRRVLVLRFNPCRVFSGLATGWVRDVGVPRMQVSIPVGFFQALQPAERRRRDF